MNADDDFADTNEVVYYHSNTLFSVYALSDASEGVVERYRYDAYGACTVLDADGSADADGMSDVWNPYAFTGRRVDLESRLMQYRHRYYQVSVGRFLSRDPLGYRGGLGQYGYVGSRPTRMTDTLGLAPGLAEPEFGYIIPKPSWDSFRVTKLVDEEIKHRPMYADIPIAFDPAGNPVAHVSRLIGVRRRITQTYEFWDMVSVPVYDNPFETSRAQIIYYTRDVTIQTFVPENCLEWSKWHTFRPFAADFTKGAGAGGVNVGLCSGAHCFYARYLYDNCRKPRRHVWMEIRRRHIDLYLPQSCMQLQVPYSVTVGDVKIGGLSVTIAVDWLCSREQQDLVRSQCREDAPEPKADFDEDPWPW